MKSTIILLFTVLSFVYCNSSKLAFNAEMRGHCANLEYFNGLRPGELLLGTELKSDFRYTVSDRFHAKAGILLQRTIADEKGIFVRPLFQLSYKKGGFTLNIGDIYCSNRHDLPDAIIHEQQSLTSPFEEGIQFIYDFKAIYSDLWLRYMALNTKEHLEHLNLGLYVESPKALVQSRGGLLWDHYGGQLHSVEGDYMRDTLNLFFATRVEKNREGAISSVGGELGILGSSVSKRRSSEPFQRGYGGYGKAFITFHRFESSVLYFKGDGYQTSFGNKLYEVNNHYYNLELKRTQSIANKVFIDWGVRFEFVNIKPQEFFDDTEYQAWVTIGTSLSRELLPRKE